MRVSMVIIIAILSIACRRIKIYSSPLVYTAPDTSVDFSNYHTYYLSDTIAFISGSVTDTILTGSYAQSITNEIRRNMDSRGFVLVNRNASPDIGINAGLISSTTSVQNYTTGWWANQRGWNTTAYWGRTGSYNYPFTVGYRHSTTSLLIDLVDLKNFSSPPLDVLWNAVIAAGPGAGGENNILIEEINQAFAQSPYLKTN